MSAKEKKKQLESKHTAKKYLVPVHTSYSCINMNPELPEKTICPQSNSFLSSKQKKNPLTQKRTRKSNQASIQCDSKRFQQTPLATNPGRQTPLYNITAYSSLPFLSSLHSLHSRPSTASPPPHPPLFLASPIPLHHAPALYHFSSLYFLLSHRYLLWPAQITCSPKLLPVSSLRHIAYSRLTSCILSSRGYSV